MFDDVVSVELRAVAGVTYPLIDPKFKPGAAAGELTDGLGVPFDGYHDPAS